jgi:uncharacterized membrane-anchored protein
MTTATAKHSTAMKLLNRVPEITIFFWVIKILATTVGETAADFLNDKMGLGLTGTAEVMTVLLIIALIAQFAMRRYVPPVYWLVVVLISIVGTLITDSLVETFGVGLWTTTTIFSIALAVTFAVWYAREKTLSIKSIVTFKREAFYWWAVLFTFALGTAAGDLVAEKLDVGYLWSAVLFGAMIAVTYAAYRFLHFNGVAAFWIAYILTRPLGASIGDYFSQPVDQGGRGLGTTVTSVIFLAIIAVVVIFLTITKKDQIFVTAEDEFIEHDYLGHEHLEHVEERLEEAHIEPVDAPAPAEPADGTGKVEGAD